jgi:hypothetical protein
MNEGDPDEIHEGWGQEKGLKTLAGMGKEGKSPETMEKE